MARLFFLQALVLALIAYLYMYLGIYGGLVYTVFWFDTVLHVLGGLWSALAVVWFFSLLGLRLTFWQIFLLVLSIGIAWEAFEYVFDIGGSNFMSYEVDTIKDTVNDLIGGAAGAVIARKVLSSRTELAA